MSRTSAEMVTLLGVFDTNPADVACITDDAKSHELGSSERCLVGSLTFDLRNLINQPWCPSPVLSPEKRRVLDGIEGRFCTINFS